MLLLVSARVPALASQITQHLSASHVLLLGRFAATARYGRARADMAYSDGQLTLQADDECSLHTGRRVDRLQCCLGRGADCQGSLNGRPRFCRLCARNAASARCARDRAARLSLRSITTAPPSHAPHSLAMHCCTYLLAFHTLSYLSSLSLCAPHSVPLFGTRVR